MAAVLRSVTPRALIAQLTQIATDQVRAIPFKKLWGGCPRSTFWTVPLRDFAYFRGTPPGIGKQFRPPSPEFFKWFLVDFNENWVHLYHPPVESQKYLDHPPMESEKYLGYPPPEFFKGRGHPPIFLHLQS